MVVRRKARGGHAARIDVRPVEWSDVSVLQSLGTGRNPRCKLCGVWPLGAPTLWLSWLATFSTALSLSWSCEVVLEQISECCEVAESCGLSGSTKNHFQHTKPRARPFQG